MTGDNYDGADRLTSLSQTFAATPDNVTFTLGYDPGGEIVSRSATNDAYTANPGSGSFAYVANALNQYATVNATAGSYDAAGNTTFDAQSRQSLAYDVENRLVSANKPTAVALAYDATGRLAGSTAASATTSFLYAGEALVGEYNGSAIVNRYIPGPGADETLLMYAGGGTATPRWLAADPQGSTLVWSDAAGGDRLTDSPPSPSWGGWMRALASGRVGKPCDDSERRRARLPCEPRTRIVFSPFSTSDGPRAGLWRDPGVVSTLPMKGTGAFLAAPAEGRL